MPTGGGTPHSHNSLDFWKAAVKIAAFLNLLRDKRQLSEELGAV